MTYRVTIEEKHKGRFVATLQGGRRLTCEANDPEYTIARMIEDAGMPDDNIEFFNGGMKSMTANSVYGMAKRSRRKQRE